MISRNRPGLDIDEQAMNEAILNPHASQRRRSHAEESGGDSEYAGIVAELRQLRAASQLSRYRGAAPRLPSREAISEIVESLIVGALPPPLRAARIGRARRRCVRGSDACRSVAGAQA